MFCQCGKRSQGFTAARKLGGGEFDFNYDFWVCSMCHKASRLVFEGITHGMYAPANATALLSYEGHGDGRASCVWAMKDGTKATTMVFKPYPRKVDMDQGRNILVELWHRLDSNIDQIRSAQTDNALLDYEKAQANCHAATIALIMPAFYEDSTAVLRESMTRWTARQNGTQHESPGLAETIWNPDSRFDGTPYSAESEARVRNVGALKTPVKLADNKVAFIKHTLQDGSMNAEALAKMFECSVEDIKAANDS
jgi:hypothetical protein